MLSSKKVLSFTLLFLFILMMAGCKGNVANKAIEKSTNKFKPPRQKIAEDIEDVSEEDTTIKIITEEELNKKFREMEKQLPFEVEHHYYAVTDTIDPFEPPFKRMKSNQLLRVEGSKYIGMIKTKNGKKALLKDGSGMGFVLGLGDKVESGKLKYISPDSVVFQLERYGVRSKVVLKVEKNY